jgi:hypothetical protein
MDTLYLVERGKDGIVRLRNDKAKDFEPPEPMAFKIAKVELQDLVDEEGKLEVSVVPEPIEFEPEKAPNGPSGKWQKLAHEVLQEQTFQHMANLEESGFDPITAKVTTNCWRNACMEKKMPRQRFSETLKAFKDGGIVCEEGGYVKLL